MTYEEFAEIMDNSNFMIDSSNPYDMKILEALEKQIPKKPILKGKSITLHFDGSKSTRKNFTCPNNHNIPVVCREGKMPYCPFCGQKLNWRDEE